MCFELGSSPDPFQRLMDSVIRELPGVVAYLDDLIIRSAAEEQHRNNWKNVIKNFVSTSCVLNQARKNFLKMS